ncbi:gephyrin-like molybdotransferase Glp [Nesterenkonia sp. NBAIMH1]|uniref:molybdopterin molybdotransferase MoeA n=1 Tax=Nesterenkonia sp. NBAIMH1 TaxID=2600320 RepID=UPI00143D7A50|nr:gephyrin-like molybdotransferase Glp [Nesterenkonia sp. NBAIMH1]
MTSNSTDPGSAEQGHQLDIAPGEHRNPAGHPPATARRASIDEHIGRLTAVLRPALSTRAAENLPITSPGLVGRSAAQQILAPTDLPGFDNSQMDGFAIWADDAHTADFDLPLAGVTAAGSPPQHHPRGTALAVMTGAPMPHDAPGYGPASHLIIPVEKTADGFADLTAGRTIRFRAISQKDIDPGAYVRRAGSDLAAGEQLAAPGDQLTPALLGALAGSGVAQVPVRERTRTLLITTGDEIRPPGDPLKPGELYDANGALLTAVLEGFGHQVHPAQLATDQPAAFAAQLDGLISEHQPHLIVTVGGVSAGAFEVVRHVLGPRGVSFGSVAQQPGGPQGWGTITTGAHQSGIICLPGNPVSAAVSMETLVRPALAAISAEVPPPRRLRAQLSEAMSSPHGVTQYRRVTLRPGEGTSIEAVPMGGPSSHLLAHLARADALLELTADDADVPAGATRSALLLPGRTAP